MSDVETAENQLDWLCTRRWRTERSSRLSLTLVQAETLDAARVKGAAKLACDPEGLDVKLLTR